MLKRVFYFIAVVMLLNMAVGTNLEASIVRGKRYYIKLLKKPCGFLGSKMGKFHGMQEWKDIYEAGKLGVELKRICPKAPLIRSKKKLKHLYQFLEYFANDSGNLPDCH